MGAHGVGSGAGPIVFKLGGTSFRLDGSLVRGVSKVAGVLPVERSGSPLCGLALVKGRPVPVCDLAALVGAPRSKPTPHSRLVVAEGEHGPVAFIVDSVQKPAAFGSAAVDARLADVGDALCSAHLI